MTERPTLPGGLLAGWRRRLAAWRPGRFWYASLLLHRVESLAELNRPTPLDPVQRALLNALAPPVPPRALEHLHLDRQLQSACLRELREAALVRETRPGQYESTPAGLQASQRGQRTVREQRRQTFFFVDNAALGRPPHFLNIDLPFNAAPAAAVYHRFDPSLLMDAVEATPEWKARHRFPADVQGIFTPASAEGGADWRRVILDRQEERSLLLVEVPSERNHPALLGFLASLSTGELHPDRPVFRLEEGSYEVFPDLAIEPPGASWRQAWQTWCNALPGADPALAASAVAYADGELIVRVPRSLYDAMRQLPGGPMEQEGWLLADAGRMKWPAQLVFRYGPEA